ncbi:MaoC family dehydratase [Caballeronia sp. LjRoot34]|uniref:MaoC family dehydratase n=1 Tax=Caballeronia sp. LjRoot34 TaxID=3342325 RepID=UPI003ED1586D
MGGNFYLNIGEEVVLKKEVTASAIDEFARLSGDFSPAHMNMEIMSQSPYKTRIAHGALLVAWMSHCSTEVVERLPDLRSAGETPVSLGYDRIRFLRAALIGETLTYTYRVHAVDLEKRRAVSKLEVVNQENELVCVAEHILKFIPLAGW